MLDNFLNVLTDGVPKEIEVQQKVIPKAQSNFTKRMTTELSPEPRSKESIF